MSLRGVEVVICFEGLQAIDEFLVSIFSDFEIAEIAMILSNDGFNLGGVGFVDFGDGGEELHDDFDVLDFFSGLDFSVVG